MNCFAARFSKEAVVAAMIAAVTKPPNTVSDWNRWLESILAGSLALVCSRLGSLAR